jgi:peptidoglycan hydrolase-like protein with peptidoglycan-binding domain
VWIGGAAVLVAVVAGGLAVTARTQWPSAHLGEPGNALAKAVTPALSGTLERVAVRSADGTPVPVQVRGGSIVPAGKLFAGQRVTVELTVKRPGWAGWLVGGTEHRTFTVVTPSAHLLGRWLQFKPGAPVVVGFDTPVSLVSFGAAPRLLAKPAASVPAGLVASGTHTSGALQVSAVPRSWETLPAPVKVSWFPARAFPQMLALPTPGSDIGPKRELTLTFSQPVNALFGDRRPVVTPTLPGGWRMLDDHTIAFRPRGLGFPIGSHVKVVLPRPAHLARDAGTAVTRTLSWQVPEGSTLRLQQLLAGLGYLPLDWVPSAAAVPASTGAELVAARSPPPGHFHWRFPHTPRELQRLWHPGRPGEITRGAVMMFQQTHNLTVDGLAGPVFWRALIADAVAGKRRTAGYSYVFVHRKLPQSLNLWHNGKVILRSPGNTGVPAAPTHLGTYPVFEHVSSGTMAGTNPDGSHYNDPGIRYISYFHRGEALHAFPRSSFGTPQSLGCVELPLKAAAKVWPYTPVGTLVTIEN